MSEIEALRLLQQRLNQAAERLADLIPEHWQATEKTRLHGKREGVLLAESYVAEMLRQADDNLTANDAAEGGAETEETRHA